MSEPLPKAIKFWALLSVAAPSWVIIGGAIGLPYAAIAIPAVALAVAGALVALFGTD